jgi:Na+/melibiose symporter-like transporter
LTSANATTSFINSLLNIMGPAVAGVILKLWTYRTGLLITVGGLCILLVLTNLIDIPRDKTGGRKQTSTVWKEMKEGLAQLISTKDLLMMTLMILAINIGSAFSGAVLIFYALSSFKVTASQLGVIMSGSAAGGMVAALLAKRSRKWFGRGKLFLCSIGVMAIGQLFLFVSASWYWIAIGMCFTGFGATFINVHYFTLRQELTPNHLLGRVAGTSSMLMKLAMPISFIGSGTLGEFIPVNDIFLCSSLFFMVLLIAGTRTSIVRVV